MQPTLEEIFEKILYDLGLREDEVKIITTMIPQPQQMAMLVDYIEANGYTVDHELLIEEATQIMLRTGGGVAL